MPSPAVQRAPGRIDRLLIPESVLRNTIMGLSYAAGREMLCYWLGAQIHSEGSRSSAFITTVVFPRVKSSYAQFQLVEGQMGLITNWCTKQNLWLLAQVHTHPTDEPHSEADECWPASQRLGFLSIVFPFFASMSSVREPAWYAYESQGGGIWKQINTAERFHVLPDVWLPNPGSEYSV